MAVPGAVSLRVVKVQAIEMGVPRYLLATRVRLDTADKPKT
jgi:hypothetical protein